jgi:hypothetical protein
MMLLQGIPVANGVQFPPDLPLPGILEHFLRLWPLRAKNCRAIAVMSVIN